QHPLEVDADEAAPALRVGVREEVEAVVEARVVDEDVEPPRPRHHVSRSVEVGDVDLDRLAADLGDELLRGLERPARDDHVRALRGQAPRDGGADASAPARDERPPAGEAHHRPWKRGGRRWITASSPSRESAVPLSADTVRASSGRHDSTDRPTPSQSRRLVPASANGAPAASSRARASASAVRSPPGTTRVTMPRSLASAAVSVGFVSRISIARRSPTSRGSVTVVPASGAIPTRVAPGRNFADSAAITRSAAQT